MEKIKIICTESQKENLKQLLKVGLVSTIACEIAYKLNLSSLSLDSFEYIIIKDGEDK